MVLNSLSGELIEPGFAALARGGCFVEIGKRGIKPPEWVAALGRDLRYHVVDWGETAAREPALIGAMYAQLAQGLREGSLPALPRHEFPLDEAARAFRFMAQARHAGRIVVRHGLRPAWKPRRDATYLVSGGLSGLGLEVAGWLARQGAGRLVLIGRRGAVPEAQAALAAMRAGGTDVWAESVDVGDRVALASLLRRIRAAGSTLRGIWHSAGVLDDAALLGQDEARFAHVFAPKVNGAVLLDELTRCDPLDAFVLFSSVASVLGSAGQCNHSAANAFLDALARRRAGAGLPALSINWGVWSGVGAAADRGITGRLAAQGLGAFTPEQGIAAMQRLLDAGAVQAAAVLADWARYAAHAGQGRRLPLLEQLISGVDEGVASPHPVAAAAPADFRRRIGEAPQARRRPMLLALVRERALRALGMDPGRAVDPRTPLGDLGLDSLLAVELRNTLGSALGQSLPATLLFDYPTIDALTDHLLAELFVAPPDAADEPAPAIAPAAKAGHALVGSIEELSDDEVERLLAARAGRRT
ncbi:SDR family NAD(P)-dependent oxidoreductase [Piscinibacter aquaticus]|uniref:SDR family NAD(P)-dependent oxidoreductase n=1 Tax=Piscinibacter aquaticus TaxID=392597 RepID=A0A5C6TZR3_9BURK|nr:SDR family NAD(P)-dependent oxidoreductase [Piscinibacter aquaticus]